MDVSGLAAAILQAVASNDEVGFPPRQSVISLLTTESLIFAAFSISATLALPTAAGRSRFYAKGWFAYGVVAVLFVIAVSGGFALYATMQPDPPHGVNAWVRVVGLGVGIGVQPFLALAIARAAATTKSDFNPDEG